MAKAILKANHKFTSKRFSDAHTTADRPNVSAEKLIAHHNWLWSELTPTEGKITVIKSSEFSL